jgi:hypothetical protein
MVCDRVELEVLVAAGDHAQDLPSTVPLPNLRRASKLVTT